MNNRKKRKSRRESQRKPLRSDIAAIWRRIDALAVVNFSFGSIWAVGEDLWQEALPPEYGISGRAMHPGLCTEPPSKSTFPVTVMMLFGSHSVHDGRRRFVVDDLFCEGDSRPCNFGAFPPVALDPMSYGNDDSEVRTHIRKYKGLVRRLAQPKQAELRKFLHDLYAWEAKI